MLHRFCRNTCQKEWKPFRVLLRSEGRINDFNAFSSTHRDRYRSIFPFLAVLTPAQQIRPLPIYARVCGVYDIRGIYHTRGHRNPFTRFRLAGGSRPIKCRVSGLIRARRKENAITSYSTTCPHFRSGGNR